MTACVAAISVGIEPCIVCVADKALTYDNYIVWDSDATKILPISDWGVVLTASENESHLTWVMEPLNNMRQLPEYRNRHAVMQELEAKLRGALDEAKDSELIFPTLLTREQYVEIISKESLNPVMHSLADRVNKFCLDIALLVCGCDHEHKPFIFQLNGNGLLTDYSGPGFHAVGSGAEKAISQLLFAEHKRSHSIARTLYECFDAKAHAEMAIGVGYDWDACLVTRRGQKLIPKEAKSLIEKVWSRANWSPFKSEREEDDLDDPPENWKEDLDANIQLLLN